MILYKCSTVDSSTRTHPPEEAELEYCAVQVQVVCNISQSASLFAQSSQQI